MAQTLYTTSAEISTRVSALGVSLRDDDMPGTGSLDGVVGAISDASTELDGYALRIYSPASLAGSAWVRKKCTDIAVYFLCLRRLNDPPRAAQAQYDQALKDLEGVRGGKIAIPDAYERRGLAPELSNVRVGLQPTPRIVVSDNLSTGKDTGYIRDNDWTEPR